MKHFSMIRSFQLADFFTLANAACGALMVFLAAAYIGTQSVDTFMLAAVMAPAALVFDVLDGRIARWRHQSSAMGRELDSLADVISFGVGPATLAYAGGMRGGWDVAILIFFVCCGVSRLARYNVTAETLSAGAAKVPYFEGTPIPTSVFLVLMLGLAAWQERLGEQLWFGATTLGPWGLHPLSLAFLASGSLMISTIRIPKL